MNPYILMIWSQIPAGIPTIYRPFNLPHVLIMIIQYVFVVQEFTLLAISRFPLAFTQELRLYVFAVLLKRL